MNNKVELYNKAARYRAYVNLISNEEVAQNILDLVAELEQKALLPDEEDVRTLAYDLWRQAGRPENRDDEFWMKAERQLITRLRQSS